MRHSVKIVTILFAASASLISMGGCAIQTDTAVTGNQPSVSVDAGGAAGIQPAQPSDAPDAGQVAKRRAPEAVGSVIGVTFGEDSVQVQFEPDPGYEYYAGTTFDIPFWAATAIDGETAVVLGDLVAGDRINVWTGACRESYPVQCDVEAVTDAS